MTEAADTYLLTGPTCTKSVPESAWDAEPHPRKSDEKNVETCSRGCYLVGSATVWDNLRFLGRQGPIAIQSNGIREGRVLFDTVMTWRLL